MEYVFSNKKCRLILVGDTAQLPPVGIAISPALDQNEFRKRHFVTFEAMLTDVVRQYENSGILLNATNIRNLIQGSTEEKIVCKLMEFKDVVRITGEYLIEEISGSYGRDRIDEAIVITRSNKQANRYNQGIRNRILAREEQISTGDLLMIVKNNYHWVQNDENLDFIANGDIVEIVKIFGFEERYGFNFANVLIRFVDYKDLEIRTKILLDTLTSESPALNEGDNRKLFYEIMNDYSEIKSKRKKINEVRENPFFNALQVKFAYAVTCHKAQGGQWKTVFIDHGYMTEESLNIEFLRWLYTAFTRAIDKVYIVNFNKMFFGQDEMDM